MKITAAVVPVRSAPFEIETFDLAPPLADEVLVRVVASGMCHTDLHARDGYFPNLPYPVVCGHEGAGIRAVGAATARFERTSTFTIRDALGATTARIRRNHGNEITTGSPGARSPMPAPTCSMQRFALVRLPIQEMKFARKELGMR